MVVVVAVGGRPLAPVGAIIGSLVSISDRGLAYLLALYAGFFLRWAQPTCSRRHTAVLRGGAWG
jgi:hypothetical protein